MSPDWAFTHAAILYGTLGTEAFLSLHKELVKLSQEKSVRYVFRQTWTKWRKKQTSDCAQEILSLQGYGAELAVKNMEYKAVDDSKVKGEGHALDGGDAEHDEVGGFDFKVLLKRKPELEEDLLSFRDQLSAEVSNADEIKVILVPSVSNVQDRARGSALDVTGLFLM